MYERFYGLATDPFRLSPDHHFCFNHDNFARAKAYIDYALHRAEGFVMITGRPGTGKTTLVHDLLDRLAGTDVKVAMLMSTRLGAEDLLRMTAYAFGLDPKAPNKAMVLQGLMDFLSQQYQHGQRALLIIDESQDLAASALEELRLLTNLQHAGQPLLQIVLIGQESLRDLVRSREMEQLHQRLLAAWHLEPLGPVETVGYIQHRLTKAGWQGDPEFQPGVMQAIHGFSGGVPRMINLVCSRLLLHGFIEELHVIAVADAEFVLGELRQEELAPRNFSPVSDAHEHGAEVCALDADENGSAALAPIIALDSSDATSNIDWSRIDQGLSLTPEPNHGSGNAPADQPPPSAVIQVGQDLKKPEDAPRRPAEQRSPARDAHPQMNQVLRHEDDVNWHPAAAETIPNAAFADPPVSGSAHVWRWLLGLGLGFGLTGLVAAISLREFVTWRPLVDQIAQWARTMSAEVTTTLSGTHEQASEPPPWDAPAAESNLHQAPSPLTAERAPATATPAANSPRAPGPDDAPSPGSSQIAPAVPPSAIAPLSTVATTDQRSDASVSGMSSPFSMPESQAPVPDVIDATRDAAETRQVSLAESNSTSLALDADRLNRSTETATVLPQPTSDGAIASVDPRLEPPPFDPMTAQVLFGWNSAEIEARFEPMLAGAIALLKQSGNAIAEVVGYSDRYGSAAYNLDLSRRRANAVADYLVAHGAPRERLRIEGRGPRDPEIMEKSSRETAKSEGRMVELSVKPRTD
jgi:type II secretory pathway predicted ATPase ExeA/outer membrane protein OmpA-like peptidoglycan-associated protein